jgi:soluble lytic murein transglycosylase-like protein
LEVSLVRRIFAPLTVALVAAVIPSQASAEVAHTVQPGETLWTIASANNLTNRALAVYNGLSPESNVILGSTIKVPTVAEAAAALAGAPPATVAPSTTTASSGTTAPPPPPMGGYTVRWGDTLSGLAATSGVPASQIAAMNGLDPSGVLLAGTVLKLPSGAPAPVNAATPAPTPVVPQASPEPTNTRLDAGTVQSIAAEHGVPPSLAAAIGWQESGFNNAMVSGANARGIMQVMPGTWNWIQQNLAGQQLDPASAVDNVRAGVLYLGNLLKQTGGDQASAIAAYYQGLGSLRSRGMFDDTKRYVANVQALQSRFGG